MPHSRFFLKTPFCLGDRPLLEGEEAHHLARVMRKREGEAVELVNGDNQLALAEICTFEKKGVRLLVRAIEERAPPSYPIILCQALPKLSALDFVVEKGTELGMTELWLFPGALSEKKELTPTQLNRLFILSIAAMKQSGRLDLPKIVVKPALKGWDRPEYPGYFGDTDLQAPPFSTIFHKENGVLFIVGPEAGLTPLEEAHLLSLGLQGVRLHPNILRAETAPLVALSLIAASP